MRRLCTFLLISTLIPSGALLAQDSLDGLIDIPRPAAGTPVFGSAETLPMIGTQTFGQPMGALDPNVVPYQDPSQQEAEPFFEFSDEPSVGNTTATVGPSVMWPGDVRTPADEEAPLLGQAGIAHLLLTPEQVVAQDAVERAQAAAQEQARVHGGMLAQDFSILSPVDLPDLGTRNIADLMEDPSSVNSFAPVATDPVPGTVIEGDVTDTLPLIAPAEAPSPVQTDPHARFSFQDNPALPDLPTGPMIMVPPNSSVQGRFATAGTADPEWNEAAAGLGVVRIDLPEGMGGVTLVLGAEVPVFWGVNAQKGTTVDGVLLYGPTAEFSTFGAKTTTRERAPVVRRSDLGKDEAERLVRNGGGGVVAWQTAAP